MAYLLCIVDAPGFPRCTVVESTLPPSHLWLSGKRPYGLLLVSLSLSSLSVCPFYRFYAEFGVFLPPYLSIIPIPVDRQLAGVPWAEPTDFQKRPPYQEAVSNSTKSYPYRPRPIPYRGDLPYAHRSYLPLPCTRRPLYITAKRVPRR